MKKILAALALCGALCTPALAAANVDAAVKTFAATGEDPAKLKIFCEMSKVMSADDTQDEAKSKAADEQINGFMKQLGADFETAWHVGDELDPESADGKSFGAALDAIDGKCPK